ncbi:acyl-CoA dehydrogenase [Sphingomonas baiyangensis]|uniref:Acyl-CoA dehydrogenase n=1 Tax=Sphingomonas baiyangensis TaxID=2572576 RepID=A0A4U1L2D1_9SPHN|nr:acyl-CoA dehydrogenase [Sphingomonas baiyangensis]TKD50370.1 acyl-CoA dehydrogenase [Sphingomonas baiyangensis]
MGYARQVAALSRHLAVTPFLPALEAATPDSVDRETWDAVLEQAARMAEGVIDPLDATLDAVGARLIDGRVVTPPGHRAAWERFAGDGWLTLSLPEALGGQGLPLTLTTACEEVFNRASPAFAMLATPNRTAAAMLAEAAPEIAAEWAPRLASGEWGATICISEPDAGSDVARIRTRAVADGEGGWCVTGEKCWISFGDHDLTTRIGHCMLARSSNAPGVRGLSLFLVPDLRDDGGANGVTVRRIEEKLGLHGSPTCVMGFEDSAAMLIGAEGRGLQTLFQMMLAMRLSCAPQGVGVAEAAFDTALSYAQERRQGGHAGAPPVAIVAHADVQRQLLRMAGRIEAARGIALMAASAMDLAERGPQSERAGWMALAQFLLPIAKDGSARLAFDVASEAVQVLGGAGYTREWPVERRLRDARVFAVFEGTTGIQALDMVHRRLWRDGGEGLARFVAAARADCDASDQGRALSDALNRLEATAGVLAGWQARARDAEAGSVAFLDLCGLLVGGWVSLRLARDAGQDETGRRLAAAARFHLAELPAEVGRLATLAVMGEHWHEGFEALLA